MCASLVRKVGNTKLTANIFGVVLCARSPCYVKFSPVLEPVYMVRKPLQVTVLLTGDMPYENTMLPNP